MAAIPSDAPRDVRSQRFATTQWSIVLAAADARTQVSRDALAFLCERYWYPVYAHIRCRTDSVHDCQDLTQGFFAHLLEKQTIHRADPSRGRFRDFLSTALRNFLANEWDKARTARRASGTFELSLDFESGETRYRIEPVHELTPEKLFERRWLLTLLNEVLEGLRTELVDAGKSAYFEQFKSAITERTVADDYSAAAVALGITPAAAKQAAYRLRKRYRELFRAEVARTVAREEDVDEELVRLLKNFD